MKESIRLVHYNNKSRKGIYIGVKLDNKRERLYKFTPNTPLDLYITQAKSSHNWRTLQKNVKSWHEDTSYQEKAIKKIKAKGRLNNKFKTGHAIYQTDLSRLGRKGELDKLYNRLLGRLVLDKKLLPIILANRSKLRRFFTHEVIVHGTLNGKTIEAVKYLDVGKRLPEEVFNSYYRQLAYKKGTLLTNDKIKRDASVLRIKKASIKIPAEHYETSGSTIKQVFVKTTYQIG